MRPPRLPAREVAHAAMKVYAAFRRRGLGQQPGPYRGLAQWPVLMPAGRNAPPSSYAYAALCTLVCNGSMRADGRARTLWKAVGHLAMHLEVPSFATEDQGEEGKGERCFAGGSQQLHVCCMHAGCCMRMDC
eukprot:353182-Chlamydomonas_euryale.AAC.68